MSSSSHNQMISNVSSPAHVTWAAACLRPRTRSHKCRATDSRTVAIERRLTPRLHFPLEMKSALAYAATMGGLAWTHVHTHGLFCILWNAYFSAAPDRHQAPSSVVAINLPLITALNERTSQASVHTTLACGEFAVNSV